MIAPEYYLNKKTKRQTGRLWPDHEWKIKYHQYPQSTAACLALLSSDTTRDSQTQDNSSYSCPLLLLLLEKFANIPTISWMVSIGAVIAKAI